MAIDRTGISSLQTGAPEITYTGDQGPKSPDQMLMASADPMLVEEYNKYVFEMEEQELQPISFREFVQQIMSESRMAEGGIARLGYANGQLVQPGPGRPGYQGDRWSDPGMSPGQKHDPSPSPQRDSQPTSRPSIMDTDPGQITREVRALQKAMRDQGSGSDAGDYVTMHQHLQDPERFEAPEVKKTPGDIHRDWRKEQEKKTYKKLMLHKMKGSPFTFPSIFGSFTEPMSDEEFFDTYGMKWEDFKTMNPMQMEAIFGSVKGAKHATGLEKISLADRDDIRRLSGGIKEGGDWEEIFYGPKGPPQPSRDESPIYPYPRDMHPGTDSTTDPVDDWNVASLDQPYDRSTPGHDFSGEWFYGADGGRVPAAYGGIMGDDGRRAYGLGSIFKKAKKAVKKFTKSKAGKIALMYALGTGLGSFTAAGTGTGLGRFAPSNLGALASWFKQDPSKALDWKTNPLSNWKAMAGIGGISALGYLTADEDEDESDKYKEWLAEKNAWLDRIGDFPVDPVDPIYQRTAMSADGGRIGLDEGGSPHSEFREEGLNRTAREIFLNKLYGIEPRRWAQEGGLMDLGGMEKDYRQEGGFVPLGGEERADDVPARLSKNEFVFTADAVRAAGGGDIDAGAEVMENVMENLEQGGQVSEESQGLEGARNMFATAQRLEGVL